MPESRQSVLEPDFARLGLIKPEMVQVVVLPRIGTDERHDLAWSTLK